MVLIHLQLPVCFLKEETPHTNYYTLTFMHYRRKPLSLFKTPNPTSDPVLLLSNPLGWSLLRVVHEGKGMSKSCPNDDWSEKIPKNFLKVPFSKFPKFFFRFCFYVILCQMTPRLKVKFKT